MISDCRIYTPDGKLKEVVSGETLSARSWEREFGGETYVVGGQQKRNRKANREPRGPSAYVKDNIRRIHDHLRLSGRAMTVPEIKARFGFEQRDWSVHTWLTNATQAQYGAWPIRRRFRFNGKSESTSPYEYFVVEVEK